VAAPLVEGQRGDEAEQHHDVQDEQPADGRCGGGQPERAAVRAAEVQAERQEQHEARHVPDRNEPVPAPPHSSARVQGLLGRQRPVGEDEHRRDREPADQEGEVDAEQPAEQAVAARRRCGPGLIETTTSEPIRPWIDRMRRVPGLSRPKARTSPSKYRLAGSRALSAASQLIEVPDTARKRAASCAPSWSGSSRVRTDREHPHRPLAGHLPGQEQREQQQRHDAEGGVEGDPGGAERQVVPAHL
jgi:hypothetical protein